NRRNDRYGILLFLRGRLPKHRICIFLCLLQLQKLLDHLHVIPSPKSSNTTAPIMYLSKGNYSVGRGVRSVVPSSVLDHGDRSVVPLKIRDKEADPTTHFLNDFFVIGDTWW